MNHTNLPNNNPKPIDLCIVGGGLAGISAALEARRLHPEWRIVLTESRSRLGGRAGSFIDPKTKNWVDNCQHVGLGCCSALIDFVNRLGSPDAFRRVPELKFLGPDGRVDTIKGSAFLPTPLHLAPAFARLRFLSNWDKFTLGFGLLKLALTPPNWLRGKSVAKWLKSNGQTPRSIKRMWEPVLVSALNDDLERLDLANARQVFVESFFKTRDGFHLLVPAMPLGELFDERARVALSTQQIEVICNMNCQSIQSHENQFHLQFRGKDDFIAKRIIIATPWTIASEILKSMNEVKLNPITKLINQLKPSPITGIHLQLDRRICPHSEIALLDTTTQWIFDHTEADRRQTGCILPPDGQSLHIVVSASHELARKSRDEILEVIIEELKTAFPEMQSSTILSSWVVTEHAATFSPSPGIDSIRPTPSTPIKGLFLAGDWTQTGWPATMEGAIRSGLNAAQAMTDLTIIDHIS